MGLFSGKPPVVVKFLWLAHGKGLPLPHFADGGASGRDCHAANVRPIYLRPGRRDKVPLGFSLEIPAGYEVQLRPRSGLALRNGLMMVNAPGTIDSSYRGEVCAILYNSGDEDFVVERGDRIAQMVLCPVPDSHLMEVGTLRDSMRGTKGFGSSGTKG